jgi:hypothetical protein
MFTDTQIDIPEELKGLLKDSVSANSIVAAAANDALKAAIAGPLKQGILYGDIVTGIFSMESFEPGTPIEYPLDIIGAADVKFHVAYTTPDTGYVPQRTVEGDYIAMKTYMVRSSVDWSREMARYSRWNVIGRALQVMEAGFVRKRNNDGWHVILAAAVDRGISISDTSIASGLFGKRVVALAQTVMRRNAGGNSTSIDKGRLTHMGISPESLQDVRSWDLTQVDDVTRREIFLSEDEMRPLSKVFGVILIDIDELGVGQEYQLYYNDTLGATTPNSKSEIAIGLDLAHGATDAFTMPWVKRENGQALQMFDDPVLIRHGRKGYFGEMRYGCGCLDNRRLLIVGI